MSVIKLHLEEEEYDPVSRLAARLMVEPEDLVYAALDEFMRRGEDEKLADEVWETRQARRDNLPKWADAARSVHAYECLPDENPNRMM